MTLHLPTRNDPIARLALLAIFGLALLVNVSRFDRPIASAKQDVILTATPALPIAPAYQNSAGNSDYVAPVATEVPDPVSLDVAPASAPPVAPIEAAPIVVDQAPAAEPPAPLVDEQPAMAAPTMPPPAPAEDPHGTKAAPDRAAHYNEATAPDDNAPEQQHGAALDPTSAARWCAAAASAGVAHCIEGDAP